MKPGEGADRPSVLAINPRNREASAARRVKLLAAFGSLSEDDRADLLEAVESITHLAHGGTGTERDEARRVIHLMYVAAGWEGITS